MKVTIDGVEYAPLSKLSDGADETAKAIIRMFISGYYTSVDCHKDGESARNDGCDCSGCRSLKVAIQFLGGEPPCKEESLIESILEMMK